MVGKLDQSNFNPLKVKYTNEIFSIYTWREHQIKENILISILLDASHIFLFVSQRYKSEKENFSLLDINYLKILVFSDFILFYFFLIQAEHWYIHPLRNSVNFCSSGQVQGHAWTISKSPFLFSGFWNTIPGLSALYSSQHEGLASITLD